MKTGILLVASGSTRSDARREYDAFERTAAARHPDAAIAWAFSAAPIRRKLAAAGIRAQDPASALSAMRSAGITHLAVQSLHVVPGPSVAALRRTVATWLRAARAEGGPPPPFAAIAFGEPLLSCPDDIERVVAGMLAGLPAGTEQDALLLMGHGDAQGHTAATYRGVAEALRRAHPRAELATLSGQPAFDELLKTLAEAPPARVFLLPFTAVAGYHARVDLAGAQADSWASRIRALGIACIPMLRGLVAQPRVAEIWLQHLDSAMKSVQNPAE